jgi:hypothetical protein
MLFNHELINLDHCDFIIWSLCLILPPAKSPASQLDYHIIIYFFYLFCVASRDRREQKAKCLNGCRVGDLTSQWVCIRICFPILDTNDYRSSTSPPIYKRPISPALPTQLVSFTKATSHM